MVDDPNDRFLDALWLFNHFFAKFGLGALHLFTFLGSDIFSHETIP